MCLSIDVVEAHSIRAYSVKTTLLHWPLCFPINSNLSVRWAKELTLAKSIPDLAGRDIFHICAESDQLPHFDLETVVSIFPITQSFGEGKC